MDWVLFCQIEVIVLTIGLVCSFIISMNYAQKDSSWSRRAAAIGESLKSLSKEMNANRNDSNNRIVKELIDAIKQNKKE